MKQVRGIEFHAGSREERLPDFAPDFPYIASRAELDCYPERLVPWHWHRAVELFYMESGALEYNTPQGKALFPAGSGGFVNSGVLHMTRPQGRGEENVQLVHLFDPALIAGEPGSRIGQNYVLPLTAAPQVELIALCPGDLRHPGGVYPLVPLADGLPDAGPGGYLPHRDRARLRPGQQQLFRQAVPGGDGLHPVGLPPQMAGS